MLGGTTGSAVLEHYIPQIASMKEKRQVMLHLSGKIFALIRCMTCIITNADLALWGKCERAALG